MEENTKPTIIQQLDDQDTEDLKDPKLSDNWQANLFIQAGGKIISLRRWLRKPMKD